MYDEKTQVNFKTINNLSHLLEKMQNAVYTKNVY